jgi:Carbohydrate family 9 binding domain-like/Glycoside hydrolase 123, catalytic domain
MVRAKWWVVVVMVIAVGGSGYGASRNLINNGGFDKDDLREFTFRPQFIRPDKKTLDSKYSIFTEDGTWNRCARIDLVRYLVGKKGERLIHAQLAIGGAKGGDFQDGRKALKVKPETTYEFSLELRGTINRVNISTFLYKGACKTYGDYDKGKTSLKNVKVMEGWTRYKGTFKTNKVTKRVALRMSIYTAERYGLTEKPNTYLLVDNVSIREKTVPTLGAASGPRVVHVDGKPGALGVFVSQAPKMDGKLDDPIWKKARVMGSFRALRGSKAARIQTEARVIAGPKALYVGIRCSEPAMDKLKATVMKDGGPVFRDDCVEIFFGSERPDIMLRQFVINSKGVRYMGWGNQPIQPKNYADWQAAAALGEREWTVEVMLPYDKVLGWKGRPASGHGIAFNVARERAADQVELSSWASVDGNFHSVARYGELVFGAFKDNLTARLASLQKELNDIPAKLPEEALKARKDLTATLAQWTAAAKKDVSAEQWARGDVALRTTAEQMRFLKLANKRFAVTVARPSAGFQTPFVPDAILNPPKSITCYASVNEFESLPVVITNLTDKAAAYRVLLFSHVKNYIEVDGLRSADGLFPQDQVILREGIRVKDSDEKTHGIRIDPLPRMNEAGTITIPPRDSGVVWITFRCEGVAPGEYKGTLRVIPLSEPAKFVLKGGWNYEGPMKDIPLSLTVWPITLSKKAALPMWICDGAVNEAFFVDMLEHGVENFQISPYLFPAKFKADGSMDGAIDTARIDPILENYARWIKKHKVSNKPALMVGFSAYRVFEKVWVKKQFKPGSPELARAWAEWIKGMDAVMKKHGFGTEDYVVEVWDEPSLKVYDEVLASLKVAKKAVPDMQLQITFGHSYIGVKDLERLKPFLDIWCLWDSHWDRPEYIAFYKQLQKEGRKAWFYACSTHMRVPPYQYYRLHAWKAIQRNLDAIGLWNYITGPGGYYGRASWKLNAHGGLTYNTSGRPVTSVRLELLREGMDDIKYIARLRALIAQARGRGVAVDLAARADQFLETSIKRVVVNEYHREGLADEIRQQAARLILALQSALARK